MDALTSVLSAMKFSGSVFLEAEFTRPWCVESQIGPDDCKAYFREPAHVISYHYVISGKLLCAIGPEPPRTVRAGQIMLLPRNERHLMGSGLSVEPARTRDLIRLPEDGRLPRIEWGGGGEATALLCGFLGTVSPVNAFLLSLPSLLIVDAAADPSGEWLASSIRYATSESIRSPELVGRLAELLFAEAVRRYVRALPDGECGWLAGLRDSHVSRALTLLHSRQAEPWTTEALAREVGLSRSTFAERFTHLIREPPMRYLARHRMNIAANLLREGEQNTCNIAYAIGFNSEAAFNRAFKKEYGVPPGQWRKSRGQTVASDAAEATSAA
jgi:AraC-like DNA-binding protein